jgi:RHS repeat-associated protein
MRPPGGGDTDRPCPGCSCSNDATARISGTYYHGDHLAGTALLTSADGSVAAEIAYDPWGSQLVGTTEPYTFTGKEHEPDIGLYDFGARLYDAVLGVFLSPDPVAVTNPERLLADPQLLDPYSYARNSPATYVDPDGREPLSAAGAGGQTFEPVAEVRTGKDGVTYINFRLSSEPSSAAATPPSGSLGPAGAARAGALGAVGGQGHSASSPGRRAAALAMGGAVAVGVAAALAPRTALPRLSGAATGAGVAMLTGKGAAVAVGGALLGVGIATGLKAVGFAIAGRLRST